MGQSSSDRAEDAAVSKFHAVEIQWLRNAALEQAKEQRKQKLQHAANRLRSSREEEAKMIKSLDYAREELNQGIIAILENSTRELATPKEKIEPLVEFFKTILGEIDHNIDENLQAFLRLIINGIKEGTNAKEVEAITISRRSKEKMMSTTLPMQGHFSAIAKISTAYIAMLADYIRPAINRMERLSTP
ncbi:hypothetical protein QQZ08_007946 [Neonectria magnoliae]|uniref:Uncharacterized protein n=1 Tax=Neonectria magnoliae TaxID=2732573 RepID=A0ABR1HWR2_9HYPO